MNSPRAPKTTPLAIQPVARDKNGAPVWVGKISSATPAPGGRVPDVFCEIFVLDDGRSSCCFFSEFCGESTVKKYRYLLLEVLKKEKPRQIFSKISMSDISWLGTKFGQRRQGLRPKYQKSTTRMSAWKLGSKVRINEL